MIENVIEIVSHYKKLKYQLNKGDRLRIMKDGWYGSVWVEYKKNINKYRFLLTGDVDTELFSQIEYLHGNYNLETRGYKYWDLNESDVEEIIRLYANID